MSHTQFNSNAINEGNTNKKICVQTNINFKSKVQYNSNNIMHHRQTEC